MKSVRALAGMPAVCVKTGRRLGRVTAVSTDKALLKVTGIWVTGRLGRAAFYPGRSISVIGERAVMICGEKSREPAGEKLALRRAVNAAGELIGAVTNAYADEETLLIQAVELSRGIFDDIARGRKLVRLYRVAGETGDAVILEEREETSEERLGSRDDCRGDYGCVGGNGVRYDELGTGTQNGTLRDECRTCDCR